MCYVFMPGRIRAPSVLNQAKSGQCIDIDSRHPQPSPPPGVDATGNVDFVTGNSVICVAPQDGAFVYAFSGHGVYRYSNLMLHSNLLHPPRTTFRTVSLLTPSC